VGAERQRQAGRGQRVGEVVAAGQAQRGGVPQPALHPGDARQGDAGLHPETARLDVAGRERHPPAGRGGGVGRDHRVVGRVQRPVVIALVGPDARLGGRVRVQVGMPVEVVGREVEPGAGGQPEAVGETQLEAGQLDHDRLGRRGGQHSVDQRPADVAGGHGAQAAGVQHGRGQLGGGGLAVGAGDPDQRHAGQAGAELDLAPDRHARAERRLCQRMALWQARRDQQELPAFEQLDRAGPEVGLYPGRGQRGHVQVGRVVAGEHVGPERGQLPRRGTAGSAQPGDEDGYAGNPPLSHSSPHG
jgi:hypothetical protein